MLPNDVQQMTKMLQGKIRSLMWVQMQDAPTNRAQEESAELMRKAQQMVEKEELDMDGNIVNSSAKVIEDGPSE